MQEKKVNLKIIIPVLILIGIVVATIVILSIVNKTSPEKYLEKGEFRTAYMKTKDEEKTAVLLENLVTTLCGQLRETYKVPSSFRVTDIWKKGTDIVVLSSGENGMGETTANYSIYRYVEDKEEYVFVTTVTSLEQEKISQSDNKETTYQKAYDNVLRKTMKTIISDESRIDSAIVKRINKLSLNNRLSEIELLDETREWCHTASVQQ